MKPLSPGSLAGLVLTFIVAVRAPSQAQECPFDVNDPETHDRHAGVTRTLGLLFVPGEGWRQGLMMDGRRMRPESASKEVAPEEVQAQVCDELARRGGAARARQDQARETYRKDRDDAMKLLREYPDYALGAMTASYWQTTVAPAVAKVTQSEWYQPDREFVGLFDDAEAHYRRASAQAEDDHDAAAALAEAERKRETGVMDSVSGWIKDATSEVAGSVAAFTGLGDAAEFNRRLQEFDTSAGPGDSEQCSILKSRLRGECQNVNAGGVAVQGLLKSSCPRYLESAQSACR